MAATRSLFTGDTYWYVLDIQNSLGHRLTDFPRLWDFPHVLWRPLGRVLSEFSFLSALLPHFHNNAATSITFLLVCLNVCAALVCWPRGSSCRRETDEKRLDAYASRSVVFMRERLHAGLFALRQQLCFRLGVSSWRHFIFQGFIATAHGRRPLRVRASLKHRRPVVGSVSGFNSGRAFRRPGFGYEPSFFHSGKPAFYPAGQPVERAAGASHIPRC